MREKLKAIIDNFGIKNQLKKLNEEVYELIEAINENDLSHITEEFADCMVILSQIGIYFDLDHIEIDTIGQNKIDRTIERIKEGYYK